MKQGDILFVYGTLRRGESHGLDKSSSVLFLKEGRINGLMYHLGGFPGVTLERGSFNPDEPVVEGDLFMIRDDQIVSVLDAYEGYPSLYGKTETETEDGHIVWVYTYNGDVSHKEPLRVGDWRTGKLAHLELRAES